MILAESSKRTQQTKTNIFFWSNSSQPAVARCRWRLYNDMTDLLTGGSHQVEKGTIAMSHFADRLIAAIKEKGNAACVGIDPVFDRLPADFTANVDQSDTEAVIDGVLEYGRKVIRIVAPHIPAVKLNIAFFEQFLWEGVEAYFDLVQEANSLGLIVVGDIKRGDIGHSSSAYATGHLAGTESMTMQGMQSPDAVTINPYFGLDGVKPFIDAAKGEGKGVFVLVRTSNESADSIQGLHTGDGRTVADEVGKLVEEWAIEDGLVGSSGYSAVGAVVSPTDVEATRRLRQAMPHCFFLVPGFGAQGRTADDVACCFREDGLGALVNASRSVIYAYENMKYIEMYTSEWDKCVEHACRDFVKSLNQAVPAMTAT
jgi:orotidine-5'-phosphate decarboxylase